MTNVTGFGMLGHLLEMCRGAGLEAWLRLPDVLMLAGVAELAQAGVGTGAASRNWDSSGSEVAAPGSLLGWQRGLLCGPQTSGSLLIAAATVEPLMQCLHAAGFAQAAAIGTMVAGTAGVEVTA